MKNKLYLKIGLVGLVGGLVGAGAYDGVATGIQHVQSQIAMKAPASSNKVGGTSVSKEKAQETQSETAYKSMKNSVVSILNQQEVTSMTQEQAELAQIFGEDAVLGDDTKPQLRTVSEGSGVIYKKSGGAAYLVTNNHVVKGAKKLKVVMSNGQKVTAKLVGHDTQSDLAVLKIGSAGVKQVASFANSNQVEAGEDVLAIGSPLGSDYANTVTKGVISSPKREVAESSHGHKMSVIQTDAAINSGNSGGPLINMQGQIVGINSMKLSSGQDGQSVEGMGFSIPSNKVVSVINKLTNNK